MNIYFREGKSQIGDVDPSEKIFKAGKLHMSHFSVYLCLILGHGGDASESVTTSLSQPSTVGV